MGFPYVHFYRVDAMIEMTTSTKIEAPIVDKVHLAIH